MLRLMFIFLLCFVDIHHCLENVFISCQYVVRAFKMSTKRDSDMVDFVREYAMRKTHNLQTLLLLLLPLLLKTIRNEAIATVRNHRSSAGC